MIAEIKRLNPKPGSGVRIDARAADRSGRVRARGTRRLVAGRTEFRHAAENAAQPDLSRAGLEDRGASRRTRPISPRSCNRRPGSFVRSISARKHNPESVGRNREAAGRLLRARRPASASAQSEDDRGRDPHARIDGVARHREQIHGDRARHFRAEIFLHLGDRCVQWRRSAFGRSRAASHQASDRGGEPPETFCPTTRSWTSCARPASTSRAARSRNIAKAMRIASSVQRRREKQGAAMAR